jgi:hypothetical protein
MSMLRNTAMRSKLPGWLAIVLMLEIGLIHIMAAQGEYDEAAYMGYLFAANFLGALIAAFGMYRGRLWGWMLGLLIAVGSMAGYIWSRTLGMPRMNVEEWFSPYGIVSMAAEGLFILLALARPWLAPAARLPASKLSPGYPSLAAGLLLVISVGFLTYQWDAGLAQAYGHHVGSLHQVLDTPQTAAAELEERYGVRVSLVAISMMNSIVDVRIKILDPEKASLLLRNQAALLVGDQQTLFYCSTTGAETPMILAPHMHSHGSTTLHAQKLATFFFPSQQIIHTGSEVSLVFGTIRTEPIVVQ